MPRAEQEIVVIGGGQAASSFIETLRALGSRAPIWLVGEERLLPYQRPPLSKNFFTSSGDPNELLLKPAGYFSRNGVTTSLSVSAAQIDRVQRQVRLSNGCTLSYDTLALMTGARARPLDIPGAKLPNVHMLRSFADALAIRRDLSGVRNAVVIGGGFLGLEIASSFRALDLAVIVIESYGRVLGRVASEQVSAYMAERHIENGVELILGQGVAAIGAAGGRASEVILDDGRTLPADIVIVAIGGIANDELARSAGLHVERGIVTDLLGRTSDPNIVAAGDCATRPDAHLQCQVRPQSVQNAITMGQRAAHGVIGAQPPSMDAPWFWSRQYDHNLQILGFLQDGCTSRVRCSPDGSLTVSHIAADGRLVCFEAVNSFQAVAEARRDLSDCYRSLSEPLLVAGIEPPHALPLPATEWDGAPLAEADLETPDTLFAIFALTDGSQIRVAMPEGKTLKDAALENGIRGVIGECGGACACATCHVYVEEAWRERVGEPGKIEKQMLEFALNPRPGRRLSCRLKMSSALNGLVVNVPERQF